MATTYLSRTLGTPTDNNKWTFSCWLKYTRYSGTYPNSEAPFFHADAGSTTSWSFIGLDEANQLILQNRISSANVGYIISNAKLQDAGAWYNVVAVFDSSNSTAADRQILYLNGERITSFTGETQAPLNTVSNINSAIEHRIGRGHGHYGSKYFGGLMTHVHFIDGTAYPATAFGEVDSTSGIWTAKTTPSVTYGNNGFFLKMENASAMGTDSSGNSNTFTVSGSLTKNQDTPNNNFATLNPLVNTPGDTTSLSNGNNTYTNQNYNYNTRSTLGMTSGKFYWEQKVNNATAVKVGVCTSQYDPSLDTDNAGAYYGGVGGGGVYVLMSNSTTNWQRTNNDTSKNVDTYTNAIASTSSSILMGAVDVDAGKLWVGVDGVWMYSGNPATGANAQITFTNSSPDELQIMASHGDNSTPRSTQWNFGNGYFGTTPVSSAGTNASGNGIFEYDVPTGYTALSTEGLNS